MRPLLMLAAAMLLAGSLHAQGDGWVTPYPQLPQYREMVGRLFAEGPPTNRRTPDITSRGVVAAGMFRQAANPGDLVASYADFTYGSDANGLPNFDDLRAIVKNVTQVRAGDASATAAFQRRTGTPSPPFQACVDDQMLSRVYQLDARWRAVAACEDMLSWSAWTAADAVSLAGLDLQATPPASPQAQAYRWVQPYPEVPDYREFTGRLFGEAAAANDDRRFADITTAAALAVGSFRQRARPGDTIASYGVHFFNLDANNQPDIPDLRIVVKDLIEVRFLLAGTEGVNFDVRKGAATPNYQRCLDVRLPRFMYLRDARWRAMAECERTAAWSWWVRDRALPFSGTFAIDRITTFDYAWDAAAGELRITLR